jgi:glutamate 5-kinase
LPFGPAITPEIEGMAGDPVSGLSKGGMKTKIMAARTATAGGCAMIIAAGQADHALHAVLDGARATWFAPQDDPRLARKRWIGAMKPRGVLRIDAGAVAALAQGKSLLPAGLRGVEGEFGRGDPVAIHGLEGGSLGQGLVAYSSADARAIAGHHTREIESILGHPGRAALIHRDDMVL